MPENCREREYKYSRFIKRRFLAMPRRRKPPKPRKPYKRRDDLSPYQRLMRFLRWMSPALNASRLLRMLPQSEEWPHEKFARHAAELTSTLEQTGASVAALVPWAVIDAWEWPAKWRLIEGKKVEPRRYGLPPLRPLSPTDPWIRPEPGEAVLLDGELPTIEGLCQLASKLRDILDDLCETDIARIQQRWGRDITTPADFYRNGEVRAFCSLRLLVNEKITLFIPFPDRRDNGRRQPKWRIEEHARDNDFATYGEWLLMQLIRDGHAWRVMRCTSCQAWFLRVRRDPPGRPARFCSDVCRRGWHNPRRGKVPKQVKNRRG
jgi:hypothetical protein